MVGAGIAGLSAAADLQSCGYRVRVFDKGRGVGGRMATRRIGGATFDHGVQQVVATHPRFKQFLHNAQIHRAAAHWPQTEACPEGNTSPSPWCGVGGMSSIPKFLATGLDVHLERPITALKVANDGWRVEFADGSFENAGAIILTAPTPQSLALLESGGVILEPGQKARLSRLAYDRCLAVMATLDRPSRLNRFGSLAPPEGPVRWIADNQQKGISTEPAITLLASDAFSRENWNADRTAAAQELLEASREYIHAKVTSVTVHGWAYSQPLQPGLHLHEEVLGVPPLILAGDAFGGGGVQNAAASGWSAAECLTKQVYTAGNHGS